MKVKIQSVKDALRSLGKAVYDSRWTQAQEAEEDAQRAFTDYEHDGDADHLETLREHLQAISARIPTPRKQAGWAPTVRKAAEVAEKRVFDLQAALDEAQPEPLQSVNWNACVGFPPEREFLWDGLVPMGAVTTLFGAGGVGKTLLAQQLCTAVATGAQDDLCGHALRQGPVLALFAEDDADELWRRQDALNTHLGLDMADLGGFVAISGYGRDNLLMTFERGIGRTTATFAELRERVLSLRPALVVIDNIADTFGGDHTHQLEVNQFMKGAALGGLARDTGAAVLLLGHPSKAGMNDGSGMGGSMAWSNAARSRLFMRYYESDEPEADPDHRCLELRKANYAPSGTAYTLRYSAGIWKSVQQTGPTISPIDAIGRRAKVLEVMQRIIGEGENLSPNSRAGNCASKRLMRVQEIQELKMRRPELEKIIDALQSQKRIVIETYTSNRRECQRYMIYNEAAWPEAAE